MTLQTFTKRALEIELSFLVLLGFFIRAIPHLFLVSRWIIEEQYNYVTVRELVITGSSIQVGFYPILEHQLIYLTWLVTHIDPVILCQYANPLFGALTTIPLYHILRNWLSQRQSLIGCVIWSISEVSYYRTAYFGSTEALGFLFALSAIALYSRKKYWYTVPFLLFSVFSHLLPAFFAISVIGLDKFFVATKRQKIILISTGTILTVLFFSPFNPHQRLLTFVTLSSILSNFKLSNIFLYSLDDLITGATMFLCFISLGIVTSVSLIRSSKINLFSSMLIVSSALFIFSWLNYQSSVFAPPRLTLYLLIPFIFYSSRYMSLKLLTAICLISVITVYIGTPTMMTTKYSTTSNEYSALEELSDKGLLKDSGNWLSDYSIACNFILYCDSTLQWETSFNESATFYTASLRQKALTSSEYFSPFQYVFLSERMLDQAYIVEINNSRSVKLTLKLEDVWSSNPLWSLVYDKHGVKVYHYEGQL